MPTGHPGRVFCRRHPKLRPIRIDTPKYHGWKCPGCIERTAYTGRLAYAAKLRGSPALRWTSTLS